MLGLPSPMLQHTSFLRCRRQNRRFPQSSFACAPFTARQSPVVSGERPGQPALVSPLRSQNRGAAKRPLAISSAQPCSKLTAGLALFQSSLPLCGAAPSSPCRAAFVRAAPAIVFHSCAYCCLSRRSFQVKLPCCRIYVTPTTPISTVVSCLRTARSQLCDKHTILLLRRLAHHATPNWGR